MDFVDISEDSKPKKDIFMRIVIISLILLIVLAILTYFFGYDLVKNYIKI